MKHKEREENQMGLPLKIRRLVSACEDNSEHSASFGGLQSQMEAYLKQVRERFKDDNRIHTYFCKLMYSHFKHQRIDIVDLIRKVKTLFRDHPDLCLGFNTFIPKDREKQAILFDKAVDYFSKVNRRFQNDKDKLRDFLEIVYMFRDRKAIDEAHQKITKLFENHSDLLEEFPSFLPDSVTKVALFSYNVLQGGKFVGPKGNNDQITEKSHQRTYAVEIEQMEIPEKEEETKGDINKSQGGDKKLKLDANKLLENVKATLQDHNQFQEFLKHLYEYSLNIINQSQLQNLVFSMIGKDRNLMDDFNDFISQLEKIGLTSKDKEHNKYHSNEERKKGRYSSNNKNSILSGKDNKSREVYSKPICKNQHEEILFCCEDDKFELDVLLETTEATIQRVEGLLKQIKKGTVKQDGRLQIENHLTVINLLCIERIYGNDGINMICLLRERTFKALPVILTRLKQKQEEWSRYREDFNKICAAVYAKNFHKALDRRSFNIKQKDKRNLGF